MIVSLDLSTETHTQLQPPRGFDEVPFIDPSLSVLNDCLCFSHDFKQTHFIMWKMNDFGVDYSWTQLFKVSYHNLRIDYPFNDSDRCLLPVCLSEKNGTLILTNKYRRGAIIYNWRNMRNNIVQKIVRPWWWLGANYVESLVSCC